MQHHTEEIRAGRGRGHPPALPTLPGTITTSRLLLVAISYNYNISVLSYISYN